ncbi:MATE family efflux transporter [Viridibacillus arvi]|uniref:Multidrug export protein MepA n=1 Tax=Viridibacillus arvi TaxID=263475 RepID=A0A0M0LLH4_9BACL|nr:MATE family efflux transporter [Viridibacillus arvi]KOO51925.1 multidrug transporter MatE [Viridibacillus arvi]
MDNENIYYFEKAPIHKAVAHFSVPMMLGMSLTVVYSILNAYFIGMLNNSEMLAAITLTIPVFAILMAFGNLIGVGGATYISRLLGEKDYKQIKHVSSFSFYGCLLLGIVIISFCFPFVNKIITGLGASSLSFDYTKDYVTVMLIGSPFIILNFALEQLVRAEGAAKVSMIGMLLSVVVNIILDPIFIFLFDWGVTGVATATLLGNIAAVLFYAYYIVEKSDFLTLSLKNFKASKLIISNVLKIGIPVFLLSVFMGTTALFFNNFVAIYGDTSVAAYGISSRILQLPEFVIMGLCEGVVPLIAYCFTADKDRMKAVIKFTGILVATLALTFAVIVLLLSNHLIELFTIDENIISIGSYVIKVTFLSLFVSGITVLVTGIFQATGQGKPALIMSLVQGLILIPILFLANDYAEFHGVIWSLFIADFISCIVGALMLFLLRNKLTVSLDEITSNP